MEQFMFCLFPLSTDFPQKLPIQLIYVYCQANPIIWARPLIGLAGIVTKFTIQLAGRRKWEVRSSQDKARWSNAKLFLSVSVHQKQFWALNLLVMWLDVMKFQQSAQTKSYLRLSLSSTTEKPLNFQFETRVPKLDLTQPPLVYWTII